MTVYETLKELQKFVTLKTTQRPAFLDGCEEALNKQIPKKPIVDECPCCYTLVAYHVADRESGNHLSWVSDEYCGNCGQRIDWSEEE